MWDYGNQGIIRVILELVINFLFTQAGFLRKDVNIFLRETSIRTDTDPDEEQMLQLIIFFSDQIKVRKNKNA